MVTLIGICFLVPMFAKLKQQYPAVLSTIINAFACGALLAAAFYLMLYEATHLIKPEGSTEPEQITWWGSAALIGFIAPYMIDLATSAVLGAKPPSSAAPAKDGTTTIAEQASVTTIADVKPTVAMQARVGAVASPASLQPLYNLPSAYRLSNLPTARLSNLPSARPPLEPPFPCETLSA